MPGERMRELVAVESRQQTHVPAVLQLIIHAKNNPA